MQPANVSCAMPFSTSYSWLAFKAPAVVDKLSSAISAARGAVRSGAITNRMARSFRTPSIAGVYDRSILGDPLWDKINVDDAGLKTYVEPSSVRPFG